LLPVFEVATGIVGGEAEMGGTILRKVAGRSGGCTARIAVHTRVVGLGTGDGVGGVRARNIGWWLSPRVWTGKLGRGLRGSEILDKRLPHSGIGRCDGDCGLAS
jgi:hypothetical protein